MGPLPTQYLPVDRGPTLLRMRSRSLPLWERLRHRPSSERRAHLQYAHNNLHIYPLTRKVGCAQEAPFLAAKQRDAVSEGAIYSGIRAPQRCDALECTYQIGSDPPAERLDKTGTVLLEAVRATDFHDRKTRYDKQRQGDHSKPLGAVSELKAAYLVYDANLSGG
jgi:hypothetical protein